MASPTPRIVTPLPGPQAAAWVARDTACVSPSYTRDYPLVAARGDGCWIDDVDGNRFLDCTAGIAVTATGHCHPRVVAAIRDQAERLIHMSGTDFYYAPQIELAERLAQCAPGPAPKKVFFCNSGTEAVEGAIKLARYATRREKIIAFFGAFHGRSLGALSATASKAIQREGFSPLLPGVVHTPYPDTYRAPFGASAEAYAAWCVEWIRDRLFTTIASPKEVAAILVEPVQGEGGYIVPPPKFLPALRALCDQHGILLIADEIQCGMGRTGKLWACEHDGLVPDILLTAKGIASGLPLGAIISRSDVMQWPPGAHASTFGGNPIACAAALATLDLLQDSLIANAAAQGEYLLAQLRALQAKAPLIGDVRGRGLMVAVELVRDRTTKERATTERNAVIQRAFQKGLLLLGCGASGIRFCPALSITRAELEVALQIFAECL